MTAPNLPRQALQDAVRRALDEDVGSGDVTTTSVVPADAALRAAFVLREPGIIAGLPVAQEVYRQLGVEDGFDEAVPEGASLGPGDVAAVIDAPARPVLTGERVALNFLQRLSGIATCTAALVKALDGTSTRVLDTRKTTPGLRALEKYAVAVGGGVNHRMGLFDAVLIKDNHIAAVGDVARAVRAARAAVGPDVRIQVELDDPADMEAAIAAGADALLLDNMAPADVAAAVSAAHGRVTLEATGGITLSNARAYADAGVDFISSGALTHSAPSIDIGLDVRAWT